MKKNLSALFLTLLAVFVWTGCSDVPAPYDIPTGEEGGSGGIELTGDGSKDKPYDVASAMKKQDNSVAWVEAFIVGGVDEKSIQSDCRFEAPFKNDANILIAATADVKDYKQCVPVQLPSGELRTALNLVDHPDNLGKKVKLQGKLTKYFGVAGLKETSAAVIDGKEIGDAGEEPSAPGNLAELLDPTKIVPSVVLTFDDAVKDQDYAKDGFLNFYETGNRVWRGTGKQSIQATSYGSKNETDVAWFVTPAFKVNELKVKTLSFDCVSAFYVAGTKLEVFFLEKNGDKVDQNLIALNMPQNEGAQGYDIVVPLSADLSAFDGKTGFIGFKYTGGSKATGTYQIDNLYVGEEKGTTEPEQPEEPSGEELLTNPGFETWVDNVPTGWKSASTASNATLEQSTEKRSGTYAVKVKGSSANKRLATAEMTLEAGKYVYTVYLKSSTADLASARLGYVPVTDGKVGNYKYKNDYENSISNTEWVKATYSFTLAEQTTLCLLVMNSKNPGKDLLVDDASLVKEGGELPPVEKVTYVKTTTVTDGAEYVLAYHKQADVYQCAKQITSGYGYLKVDDVNAVKDEISLTGDENVFIINAVSGGYTIKQKADGRYLYQKGTYNSFNLDADPKEGQVWTITAEEDGTMKIENTLVKKYIQFDAEFSSFGSYDAAKSGKPVLFVKK